MKNEKMNEEAVSPVIATILMVAITVVLAGVLYVWASSLAGESTGGGLDTYTFSHRDANGDMSDAGLDDIVHVQMTSGDGLNWANLKVSIVVDGGVSSLCVEGGDPATSDCTWDKDEDKSWDTSEEITISEGDADLCDGEEPCSVVVTLTKVGVGEEDDKVIATVSATAENN